MGKLLYMDIYDIRLANLLAWVNERYGGNKSEAARAVDSEPAYFHQITNPKINARVGDDLARRIEKLWGKERGFMDQLHPTSVLDHLPAHEIMSETMEAVDRLERDGLYRFRSEDHKRQFTVQAYRYFSLLGKVETDYLRDMLDVIRSASDMR